VYAYSYDNPKGGFYAEYVAVAASKATHAPESLDLLHAGAVPVIGLTALQGIDDALGIESGETLIIHGASGNVGFMAVQFAKRRGARVLATASGSDGKAFVRRLGADEAIDGRRSDIVKAARRFAPDGIDAVLGLIGGKELTRCMDALRKGGRVAYPNGVEPEPRKRKGVKIQAYDGIAGPRQYERMARALEESEAEIPIAAEFGLEEAANAHRRMAKGHVLGKIVIRVPA
jgi:NADPH:quinone reductase